jgi:hypothetical protein
MEIISISDSAPIARSGCISISSSSSVPSSSSSCLDSTPFVSFYLPLPTGEDSSVEESVEESVGRNQPRVPRCFVLPSTMDDDTMNEATPLITAPSSESSAILEEGAVASSDSNTDTLLSELARELHESNSSLLLTEDDEALISGSSCNTKRYEDNNKLHLERFFSTIEAFGSTAMKGLLQDYTYDNGGIPTTEKKFFYVLRGEKTAAKQLILSKCLLLCALKWRKTTEKEKGKMYQPSTFVQYIKQLFGKFHEKQIKYCYKADFNGDGEFHAVIKRLWENEIGKDPKYGTGVKTSSFDWNGDEKLRAAYLDPNHPFNPWDTSDSSDAVKSRLRYLVHICGRVLILRGSKEIRNLQTDQFEWKTFMTGPFTGRNYAEVDLPWDKTCKPSLSNTKTREQQKDYQKPVIVEDPTDPLDPYTFLLFMFSTFEPDQKNLFCYPASSEQRKKFAAAGLPYLYNKNRAIGENIIGKCNKELALQCGFENPNECTNHGNRKYAITKLVSNCDRNCGVLIQGAARHKSITTHAIYHKTNELLQASFQRGLTGRELPPLRSPPKPPLGKRSSPPPSTAEDNRKPSAKKSFEKEKVRERYENEENIQPTNLLVTYQAPEAQAPSQPISFAASVSASGSHLGGAQTNYYNHMNHHDQRKFFLDAKASDYDQYSDDIALLKKVEGLKKEKDEAEDELVEVKRKKKKFEAALIEAERKFEGEQAKNQVLTEKIQALTAENTELKQEMRAERQAAKAAKQLRESTAAMQKQISDLQAAKTNGCIIA